MRVGSKDRETNPTTQNHETICAPPHKRRSAFSSRNSLIVEVHGLKSITSRGAAGPAPGNEPCQPPRGQRQEADDEGHRTAALRLRHGHPAGDGAGQNGKEGCPFHQRRCRRRARPFRAFPGKMPYFTGPNSAATMPKSASAIKRMATECRKKPIAAIAAIGISASRIERAMRALSNRSATSRQWPTAQKRGNENDAGERHEHAGVLAQPPSRRPNQTRMSIPSAFLRKLSFKAEQNWHQNRGQTAASASGSRTSQRLSQVGTRGRCRGPHDHK